MRQTFISLAATLILAFGFQSCDRPASLAKDMTGAWAGVPERLFDVGASSATIIETFSFSIPTDTDKTGGPATITALISVTGAVDGAEGIARPVSVTASGYATIQGSWQATSGNTVELKLDQSTLNVKVDPEAVLVTTTPLDDADDAQTARLRPQLASSITTQLRRAATERYRPVQTLKDITITDGRVLKFKIDKSSFTLTRQPD